MQTVTFPLLGLELPLSKIAFSFGNVDIYWYAIIIVLAIMIAFVILKKQDGLYGISFSTILEMSLWVIPIAFVGARVYYIVFQWDYYMQYPMEIWNVRNGGLAIYGGIIAGTLAIYGYGRKKKIKVLDMLDYIAPCLALAQAIGRWANFINVEAYGEMTNLPWRMGILQNGEIQYVHPTFLYESISCFLLFLWLLHVQKKRSYPGNVTCWYLTGYAFIRMLIEGIRIDSLMFYHFRISQLFSFLLFVVFSGVLLAFRNKCRKKEK